MASPQIEDGYTKIANELLEAFTRINLSSYQIRVLLAIIRKTYGFNKKEDWISNSQIVEMTGINMSHVSRAKKELKLKNIVTNRGNKIRLNKDYTTWRKLPIGVARHNGYQSGITVTPRGKTKLPHGGNTKETLTKETIQKKYAQFLEFYKAYPKKKSKGDAEKAFKKINPSEELLDKMLKAIEQAKKSEEWLDKDGKYIPYPASWLRAKGWLDEIKTQTNAIDNWRPKNER